MTQLARFRKRIHDVIPLTQGLNVHLDAYNGWQLVASAPLAPNHNHQGTAFGGSIYALAVVSAWSLVELLLEDSGLTGSVVIQRGEIDYAGPITDDFYALCALPDEETVARFHKSIARHGKGRLALTAHVYLGPASMHPISAPLASFHGRFVVQDVHTKRVIL
ncbi:YiiD C-terminal domain-containing protein [Marinobacter caseinilyticus]|uniref:YiiD C-terminal domain-containing protein n=1 Tax=Marinobacter caseinilyticus TaxID=2692195 RepID=UPI00140B962D|nr:YiiD C-terminal domain-containing protein [Marinobacter caseinilyticus]